MIRIVGVFQIKSCVVLAFGTEAGELSLPSVLGNISFFRYICTRNECNLEFLFAICAEIEEYPLRKHSLTGNNQMDGIFGKYKFQSVCTRSTSLRA